MSALSSELGTGGLQPAESLLTASRCPQDRIQTTQLRKLGRHRPLSPLTTIDPYDLRLFHVLLTSGSLLGCTFTLRCLLSASGPSSGITSSRKPYSCLPLPCSLTRCAGVGVRTEFMGCLARLSVDRKPWEIQQPQYGVERVSVLGNLDWAKQMGWKLGLEGNDKKRR